MKKLKFLFFSLMVFNLVACGDDEVEDVLNNKPQTKSIERLNGNWTSGCIDSEFGAFYGRRIVTLKFSNNNFEAHIDSYYSTECAAVSDRTTSYVGSYTVQKNYDANTVLLDYSVPIDALVWQLLSQKVQISDEGLLTSELISGFEKDNEFTLTLEMTRID